MESSGERQIYCTSAGCMYVLSDQEIITMVGENLYKSYIKDIEVITKYINRTRKKHVACIVGI